MNFGNIHNLVRPKPIQPPIQLQAPDEEIIEIRAKGKELFSNRTINWDKLNVIDRLKARFSSDYETKVRQEFKKYIKDRLTRSMNIPGQTYVNNNLDKLKNSIQQINDLPLSDIKELNSLIDEKETILATKFFANEKEKLLIELIDRKYLTQEQAEAFNKEHPEYQEIASREGYVKFRTAIYNEFRVPQNEQQ